MANNEQLSWTPMGEITIHPRARTHLPEELAKLTASMRVQSQIQPARGRPKDGKIELYVGNGRYLAAQSLGWESLQMIVAEQTDEAVDLQMLHENLDRQDLDPITEAKEYDYMILAHGWSQEIMAEKAGVNQSDISHSLALLNLPLEVQEIMQRHIISKSHGFLVSKLPLELQHEAANAIVKEGLSVHQTEALVHRMSGKAHGKPGPKPVANPFEHVWPHLPEGVQGKLHKGEVTLSWQNDRFPDTPALLRRLAETVPQTLVSPKAIKGSATESAAPGVANDKEEDA